MRNAANSAPSASKVGPMRASASNSLEAAAVREPQTSQELAVCESPESAQRA